MRRGQCIRIPLKSCNVQQYVDSTAVNAYTVKPVFMTTWEIRTTWELRTATSVPRSIQYRYVDMDLRNKATSEFRGVLTVPWLALILRFHCNSFHVEAGRCTMPSPVSLTCRQPALPPPAVTGRWRSQTGTRTQAGTVRVSESANRVNSCFDNFSC